MDEIRLRKVAILVDSLDPQKADTLLDQVPEDVRAQVRNLVVELRDVSEQERDEVINAFLKPSKHRDGNEEPTPFVADSFSEIEPSRDSGELAVDQASLGYDSTNRISPAFAETEVAIDPTNEGPVGGQHVGPAINRLEQTQSVSHQASSAPRQPAITPHYATHAADDETNAPNDTSTASRAAQIDPKAPSPIVQPTKTKFFAFVGEDNAQAFAGCLAFENPQAVAVVISHLAPNIAASVLRELSDELRNEVVRRIAESQSAKHDVVRELEQYLGKRFLGASCEQSTDHAKGGVRALESILNSFEREERDVILKSLRRDHPEIVARLSPDCLSASKNFVEQKQSRDSDRHTYSPSLDESPDGNPYSELTPARIGDAKNQSSGDVQEETKPQSETHDRARNGLAENPSAVDEQQSKAKDLSSSVATSQANDETIQSRFDALSKLDEATLIRVFQLADPRMVLVALAGADRRLLQKLVQQLPRKDAKQLRKQIERLGAIRIKDIRRAQNELCRVAATLKSSSHKTTTSATSDTPD